ncbi:hypothetical protein YC2023_081592 [Brassica napus]
MEANELFIYIRSHKQIVPSGTSDKTGTILRRLAWPQKMFVQRRMCNSDYSSPRRLRSPWKQLQESSLLLLSILVSFSPRST